MTLPQIISRNTPQVIGTNIQVTANETTIGTTVTTLYTVPAAKVALITSYLVRFTSFGGNADMHVNARASRIRFATVVDAAAVESAGGGIRLAATETLTLTGDSGSDNGSAIVLISLKELPA